MGVKERDGFSLGFSQIPLTDLFTYVDLEETIFSFIFAPLSGLPFPSFDGRPPGKERNTPLSFLPEFFPDALVFAAHKFLSDGRKTANEDSFVQDGREGREGGI